MKDLAARQAYMLSHPFCEYCGPLRKLVSGLPVAPYGAVECDHIWGGTGGRWDVASNLISGCRGCHDWKTRHATMGRIVAYWVKHRSGELSEPEFRSISGQLFRGWLENAIDGCAGELLPGFTGLAVDLLQKLKREGE